MSLITQWFFMILGIWLTYEAARWPGSEETVAVMALFSFGMAFRADQKRLRAAKTH